MFFDDINVVIHKFPLGKMRSLHNFMEGAYVYSTPPSAVPEESRDAHDEVSSVEGEVCVEEV